MIQSWLVSSFTHGTLPDDYENTRAWRSKTKIAQRNRNLGANKENKKFKKNLKLSSWQISCVAFSEIFFKFQCQWWVPAGGLSKEFTLSSGPESRANELFVAITQFSWNSRNLSHALTRVVRSSCEFIRTSELSKNKYSCNLSSLHECMNA